MQLSTEEEAETVNNQETDTSTETTPSATITTTPATGTQTADDAPPPPYEPGDCPIPVETDSGEPPPMYTDIVKLPTYNESQNINNEEGNESDNNRSVRKKLCSFWFICGTCFKTDFMVKHQKIHHAVIAST